MKLHVDYCSSVPLHMQVVHQFKQRILLGDLKVGDKLLSIDELAESNQLPRQTIKEAYLSLEDHHVIAEVVGDEFYVTSVDDECEIRICLVVSNLKAHVKEVYDGIIDRLGTQVAVNIQSYNRDKHLLKECIRRGLGIYSYYIIALDPDEESDEEITDCINSIPDGQLILMGKATENLEHIKYGVIFQYLENDFYRALEEVIFRIRKYRRLILLLPCAKDFPKSMESGFVKFCTTYGVSFLVTHQASPDFTIVFGDLFIVPDDECLVKLIKLSQSSCFQVGKEFGIISLHDSSFKELVENGISVLAPDFKRVGALISKMILSGSLSEFHNPLILRDRRSF